ncbi:MAG: 3'-5' exonuclease [Saprospiraceae bacterium]|nr:3'-5' exonuclease [Saprospiraceae bacterium]
MASLVKNISDILFLDIETVSLFPSLDQAPDEIWPLWTKKAKQILRKQDVSQEEAAQLYVEKAGIYSEFAKVVCISVGFFRKENNEIEEFRLKTFYEEDEHFLLQGFSNLLNAHYRLPLRSSLCGHNIREFDVPFICRRMLMQQVDIPPLIDLAGKKPWETPQILDTMQLWRFGDIKNYTSLDLLASSLNIQSSKGTMSGADVHQAYWIDKDYLGIIKYCEEDVKCVARVFARIMQISLPPDIRYKTMTVFNRELP